MSVATEITRLQNAKSAIKTSIENKGVTVPSTTKLDGYSALIDAIQTGGGSYEYESGTYEPESDVARPTISFSNTHTVPPTYLSIYDVTDDEIQPSNSCVAMNFIDMYRLFNGSYMYSATALRYGTVQYIYRGTSTTSLSTGTTHFSYNSDNTTSSSTSYPRYWVSIDGFRPYCQSTSRYWRAGRTYKWFAIWI